LQRHRVIALINKIKSDIAPIKGAMINIGATIRFSNTGTAARGLSQNPVNGQAGKQSA
jgi:hypothetical protein